MKGKENLETSRTTKGYFFRLQILATICLLLAVQAAFCTAVGRNVVVGQLAEPDLYFNDLFAGRSGWTGGDGTLSIPLPDGRVVWLFGDSFLGPVSAEGERPRDAPFVRNCLVVQKGQSLTTRYGTIDGNPAAFFPAPNASQWYWPGDGVVEGGMLRVFLHRFERTGPGLWDWRWLDTWLAALSLPDVVLKEISQAPSPGAIMFGVCILRGDADTYVYGVSGGFPKKAYLARAPARGLQEKWAYFDGSDWSNDVSEAQPILAGVSAQFAVILFRDRYYLFTMDDRTGLSRDISVYRAPEPWGPWQGPANVYRPPEAAGEITVYNPFVHPQFSENGRVLVSYNLNNFVDPEAVYRDAGTYRPRFVRVDMNALEECFDVRLKEWCSPHTAE